MASSSSAAPSAATCQSQFEQGVACAMHLWPLLEDAVEDQLGGPDSADKRDWFVGSVVELFPDLKKSKALQAADGAATDEPEQYDVEYRLLQVMDDEYELKLDDDDPSAERLAEQIIKIRADCLRGDFVRVQEVQQRFGEREQARNRGAKKARKVVVKEEENETDWDTDGDEDGEDDEDDVDMEEPPALVAQPPKEKQEPEVDEDGFTKVARKKR